MLVFLDNGVTNFEQPKLISLALVAEDGREFYAERNDFREADCSDFIQENALPLLGRVPSSSCSRSELMRRLRAWLDNLEEPATLLFNYLGDWLLMQQACGGDNLQTNIGDKLQLGESAICHPYFEQAQNEAFTQDWPPHHALADARALKAGYQTW